MWLSIVYLVAYRSQARHSVPTAETRLLGTTTFRSLHGYTFAQNVRNCQLPISSRYPVIELLVGLVFFVVAILELSLAGINLPSYVSSRTGFGLNLTQLDPPLAPIYGCHVATLAALITNALIVRDGTAEDQRTTFPKRIAIAVGAVICLVVIVWPTIHGAEEFSNSEALGTSRLWTIVAGLFFGAIAGVAYLVGRQIRLPADTDSR